jgi:hypothetical protein
VIVSSEIARGLDILELVPSGLLSKNEIDAAKSVKLDYLNVQGQPKFVWPPSLSLARAYLDQLERSKGLGAGKIAEIRQALASAERASEQERGRVLAELAARLEADVAGAQDAVKARMLAAAVRELAAGARLARTARSRRSSDGGGQRHAAEEPAVAGSSS